MKRILFYTLSGTLLILFVGSCHEDIITGEEEITIPYETLAVNDWIKDNMDLYYFWNDKIPTGIDFTKEVNPKAYFYKLVYKEKDKWSNITDDYPSLEAELNGDPVTMGYNPSFFLVGENIVVIVVSYVYPESAAADAGLKRGDIILSINNTRLDTTNYYDLYSGTSYSVQLGRLENNTLGFTGKSLDLTARITNTDPFIHYEIIDIDGHKTGYLVYVGFIAGDTDQFLQKMDNIFTGFKEAGISDLVVDLRYNPGGDVKAAIHLASEIVPLTVANDKKILISLQYNADLQAYLVLHNYSDQLYYRFKNTSANIDLDRVFFLTTSGTASASELVITGLEPHMDVIQIGESTYGKYAGAWVIPDDNKKWAMMPIVTKFSNAEGYTDFEDGLAPDYEIDDNLFAAVPFGDPSDPMLAKAIELVTGKSITPKSLRKPEPLNFRKLLPEELIMKQNLIVSPLLRFPVQ